MREDEIFGNVDEIDDNPVPGITFHSPLEDGEEGQETDEPNEEEDDFSEDLHVENDEVTPDEEE